MARNVDAPPGMGARAPPTAGQQWNRLGPRTPSGTVLRDGARRPPDRALDLDGTLSNSEPGICGTLTTAITEVGLAGAERRRAAHDDRTAIRRRAAGDRRARSSSWSVSPWPTARLRAPPACSRPACTTASAEMLDGSAEHGCTLCVATSKPETSAPPGRRAPRADATASSSSAGRRRLRPSHQGRRHRRRARPARLRRRSTSW